MPIFDIHSYFGGSLIPAVSTPAAIQATMTARGIDTAVIMSAHAARVDPIAGNRVLQKVLDQSPGFYGCLVTHVNRVDASVTAMRELMSNRKYVGMAIVGMHTEEPIQKVIADDIINAYRRYTKPLFLYARNAAMVASAQEIARAYPMIKVVLIGMGGCDWRAAIAAAHTSTNIYLDTSGPLDRAKLPAAFDAIGAHRIVFGSGSPHVDPAAAIGLVEDSALSDDVKRRIFSDNARRLFALDQS